jgi:hypothetical protein
VVGVLSGDLVAEEPGPLAAGTGDERLFLGQLQLELVMEELGEAALYLLGLGLRPGKAEQGVVGLCRGPDYAEEGLGLVHSSW